MITSFGEERAGLYEPPHDETNKMICALSEASDQPGRLIRVFAVRMNKHWALNLLIERTVKTDQTGRMPRLI